MSREQAGPVPLANASLPLIAPGVAVPAYDRAGLRPGIVHIGVGAFHRAHQALYLDKLLNLGEARDFAICGVGLLEGDARMRDALVPQDGLYVLVERASSADHARVVGSIAEYLHAPSAREAVIERMAAPECRIVSLTVTEGGYCFNQGTGAFDPDHPDVVHDLQHPESPIGLYGYLAAALRRRRERGLAPFTVLSCDNIEHNGTVARTMLTEFAVRLDPRLADWIAAEGAFPNCMVDRITPATTEADRSLVAGRFGIADAWPVVCEPFTQWVIEDDFPLGRPAWERVGALFTRDVKPYEKMKLRLLNASHIGIGYLGNLAGYAYVHEVMADPVFERFIRAFMEEVTPLVGTVPGIDLDEYKETLVERFSNTAVKDTTDRLCQHGSARVPKFVVPSAVELDARGMAAPCTALVVAGYLRYLQGDAERGGGTLPLLDPLGGRLRTLARQGGADPRLLLETCPEVFGTELPRAFGFVASLADALRQLYADGARATIARRLDA
ncbi:mannitol dehydrogenase family protein [Arenibaculum pallidiluteum]|uniref:mannitol dehydrogenase family protein n=1 Tax=Arenibaculum pallidiluteum TaxID=2812559 RepID=UPI001A97CD9D|nr:mannitol dehydrogenase family protein [Arenibaculum pallidiluteum]